MANLTNSKLGNSTSLGNATSLLSNDLSSVSSVTSLSERADAFGTSTAHTTVTATGDNNIDALLIGTKWSSNSISFSFTDSINDYEAAYPDRASHATSFQTLNATQRAVARAWIGNGGEFYNVSNLTSTELTGASDRDATIRMAMSNNPGTAFAYYPANTVQAGDAWFNRSSYNSPVIGNYAFHTFGHELGHALGLRHGHEAGGVRNVAMNADRDSMEFSIMTYRSYVGASTSGGYSNETWGYAQSLMMYDIRAIQQMYGAWFGRNASDTNYTFSTTTGEMFVNGLGQGTPGANRVFRTIWDGNGIDTYNFSNYSTNLSIDLTPGSWSDLDVGGNFQSANLGNGNYARGQVFNALQYNGDVRSLIENANGGSGNDRMVGNSADNVLNGNGGNDTIIGVGGDDTMNGGTGIDTVDYTAWNGGGTYNLATGVASFPGFYDEQILNFENIITGAGNDTVIGSAVNNRIETGAGNDTVDGGAGDDLIFLGAGNDYVNISSTGNDTFYGGSGDDYIYGYIGNETYYGESGNDTLLGYSGNDWINGGAGADSLNGGLGTDTLSYTGSVAGVTVNLSTNTVSGGDATGDTIFDFENVTGSSYDDFIVGSSLNNTIDGSSGNDNINGGDGVDLIYGGLGNDTVDGGNGDDLVYLGDGNDYLNVSSLGNDTFYGGNGDDYIYGYTGNETYYGENGNDNLLGYSGNDNLVGGAGKDTLTGGIGVDKFTFTALSQSLLASYDVITDYTAGEQIDAPSSVLATTITSTVGTATSLSAAAISSVLTSGSFGANSAKAFRVSGYAGTFLALNNATAGFNAATDAVVFLQNYTLGSVSVV